MGYSSSDITDLFDYDFTSCGGPKGKTPEPTEAEVEKFRNAVLQAQLLLVGMTIEESEDGTNDEFSKRLAAATYAQKKKLGEDIRESAIEFCKGSPSREEIMELPALQVVGWTGYLLVALSPLL